MIEEIQKTIVEAKDEIRQKYRAEVKGIFGSYARADNHADSDLDLLVDFDEDAKLLDEIFLRQFLEGKLGCRVDLLPCCVLVRELRDSVLKDLIRL